MEHFRGWRRGFDPHRWVQVVASFFRTLLDKVLGSLVFVSLT